MSPARQLAFAILTAVDRGGYASDLLAACEEIRFIRSDGQVRTVDATTVGSDAIEALIGEDHA